MKIDHTHNANQRSWVESANGHAEFPIQNLPMGVVDQDGGQIVVAIGDHVLDIQAALRLGHLNHLSSPAQVALQSSRLNNWMSLDAPERQKIRHAIFSLLEQGSPAKKNQMQLLKKQEDCLMRMPADIGDYTDFYCGIHHAKKAGALFRPDNPLLPNYKHLPIAYHGRSSSISVSGNPVRRPLGQIASENGPLLQPSARMDFELELGLWVGPGNSLGTSIPIEHAPAHIAGYALFNDWSARDIQAWEYRPLGPFQGKNFSSTIAPWVVTADALTPFRRPAMRRASDDPALLDYLENNQDQEKGGLDIYLEVHLSTSKMRAQGLPAHTLARSHTQHLYWTPAQMLTQHVLGGCNLRPGDLIATGTISTPDHSGDGSLLELTEGGATAITLSSGEQRTFLEDEDEVIFTAYCIRDDLYRIGFGECRARILAHVTS